MRKGDFVTLVIGVVGMLLFSIGMCMALIPEWNMFKPGIAVTAIGFVLLLVLVIVLWKKSGKSLPKPNWKLIGKIVYAVFATLVLGVGMCMIMVFEGMMIPGIIVGVVGIILLLCLIPMFIGFKE